MLGAVVATVDMTVVGSIEVKRNAVAIVVATVARLVVGVNDVLGFADMLELGRLFVDRQSAKREYQPRDPIPYM